jgi:hypothetical protein
LELPLVHEQVVLLGFIGRKSFIDLWHFVGSTATERYIKIFKNAKSAGSYWAAGMDMSLTQGNVFTVLTVDEWF